MEVFPLSTTDPRGCREVYQCLLSSFPGAPLPESTAGLHFEGLLVIPPPIGRTVPQGGYPTDLTELNLSGWAALVQDLVAGLQVLPSRLSHDLGLQVVALLQMLEVATGVGFCHHCCNPRSCCRCMGASQSAPPTSWSQIVEQTPGYGVTSSGGGLTTLSTSIGGMPGYVAPPPGLTPPDFSIWRPFYPRDYLYPQDTNLPLGGPHT